MFILKKLTHIKLKNEYDLNYSRMGLISRSICYKSVIDQLKKMDSDPTFTKFSIFF